MWHETKMNRGQDGETSLELGVRLFNRGEFFLAHEAWEDWWRATPDPEKKRCQGIVQIAVAMHHVSTGNLVGARSVMERALSNLELAENTFRGLDMVQLRDDIRLVIRQLRLSEEIKPFQIVQK
jgi:predicted metal-dependent hydrolase